MEDCSCQCSENCKGSNVPLKWQNQFFLQVQDGGWENIVMWEEGCCIRCAMSHAI